MTIPKLNKPMPYAIAPTWIVSTWDKPFENKGLKNRINHSHMLGTDVLYPSLVPTIHLRMSKYDISDTDITRKVAIILFLSLTFLI